MRSHLNKSRPKPHLGYHVFQTSSDTNSIITHKQYPHEFAYPDSKHTQLAPKSRYTISNHLHKLNQFHTHKHILSTSHSRTPQHVFIHTLTCHSHSFALSYLTCPISFLGPRKHASAHTIVSRASHASVRSHFHILSLARAKYDRPT